MFGRYRVDRRIGSGAFATVWLAHDDALDSPVAVKVLAENWTDRLDIRARFADEARILRRADSDHVVRVHDIGELDDGRPYFVMTYADAGTLADRLIGPLAPALVFRHALGVADGLAVLHRLGVVHRDVKPSNVLFHTGRGRERLLIADLGLARAVAHASGFTLAAGTPGYMAPEQGLMGGAIDARADVYALGALIMCMLYGRTPRMVSDQASADAALRDADRVPGPLGDVVRRALAPRSEDRFESAIEMRRALRQAGRDQPLDDETGSLSTVDTTDTIVTYREATQSARPPTKVAPPPPNRQQPPPRASQHPVRPGQPPIPAGPGPIPSGPPRTADPVGVAAQTRPPYQQPYPDQPQHRGRRRIIGLVVVAAIAAGAGTGYALYRERSGVQVVHGDGLSVKVPKSWSGQVMDGDWQLDQFGLPGKSGTGIEVSDDVSSWTKQGSSTPGVFVGVSTALHAKSPTQVLADIRHPGCTKQPAAMPGGLSGSRVRWTGCAGNVSFDDIVERRGNYDVYIQVKQPADEHKTAEILGSVKVSGTSQS